GGFLPVVVCRSPSLERPGAFRVRLLSPRGSCFTFLDENEPSVLSASLPLFLFCCMVCLLSVALSNVVGVTMQLVLGFDALSALHNHLLHILRQGTKILPGRRACTQQPIQPLARISGVAYFHLLLPPLL